MEPFRIWEPLGDPALFSEVHIDREVEEVWIEVRGETVVLTYAQIGRLYGMIHPEKTHGCCKTNFEKAIEETAESSAKESHETEDYFSNSI